MLRRDASGTPRDPEPQFPDADVDETAEWLESLNALVLRGGPERGRAILRKLLAHAHDLGAGLPPVVETPYVNTIPPDEEPDIPWDEELEQRISRLVSWNAAAMVIRANRRYPGIGGHLATHASAATLYDVGYSSFFRGRGDGGVPGDQIFFQPHATPVLYARAFLEGRIGVESLERFRRETGALDGANGRLGDKCASGGTSVGLSSYPHPRLMPDFWEFPTASMGLGPLAAVHQARFNRYLLHRRVLDTSRSRVWCFAGDGEMDEPEALGGLRLAARERLDNLVMVVNCNLQRLDGPVRGNGKIVQELEAVFRGAGWNVIKVLWGREWDGLLVRDLDGALVRRLNELLDGDSQRIALADGATIRRELFGGDSGLTRIVEHLSDEDLRSLRRGGHDPRKVYAAYWHATHHSGSPTAVLVQTVKGWALGPGVEARNVTHQVKKMSSEELRVFRDRLEIPIPDDQLDDPPFYHPGTDAPEIRYMIERRAALGGSVPRRFVRPRTGYLPAEAAFAEFRTGSSATAVSTTMGFARLLRSLLRDRHLGQRVVPIIPDEARTFGLDPLFKEFGIYSPLGQRYEPVDADTLMPYREARDGQIIEEGITEAGAVATLTAAGTSYATHGEPMVPFYVFYSMFGFQRTMDQIWAFGDARGRGFLMGATAGRTTLNGEGLQHQDGQSLLLASAVPNVRAYDPAFAFETAVIVREGLQRMLIDNEDVFYYVTLYNENYPMPTLPSGDEVEEGIIRGLYLFRAGDKAGRRVQLLGSGPLLVQALRAQQMLHDRFDVSADVWSATSYQLLHNDALEAERWNRLHPEARERRPFVADRLAPNVPVVAVTDYVKAVPAQIGRWVDGPFVPLGTDGFGRSDTRESLRRHFEIDAEHIVVGALHGLVLREQASPPEVSAAIRDLGIDPERIDPRYA